MQNKLTPKLIESIKPDPAKRLDFRDDLMAGLVLRVSQSGTKTFCLHRRISGTMRRLTIGRFGVLTLSESRERVGQVLYEIGSGRFEERTLLTPLWATSHPTPDRPAPADATAAQKRRPAQSR